MDDQSRDYGQQNFTLPHDVVTLPSQGVFYKNRKKSIKVGYLTANDENILLGGGEDMIYNLLRNKIYEPDLKIEDLVESDIEAILIFLRNTSFGPEMVLNLTDPQTKKPFQTSVNLESLSILEGQKPDEDGTFSTTLPKTGYSIKLKPLTYGDTMEINNYEKTYPQGRVAPKVTWRLMRQIVELNGTKDKGEINKVIEQMPIMDSKYIKKFLDDNVPKLDLTRTISAPSGEKLVINVGFGVDFFRPFF
jgi:hypothetical protein